MNAKILLVSWIPNKVIFSSPFRYLLPFSLIFIVFAFLSVSVPQWLIFYRPKLIDLM